MKQGIKKIVIIVLAIIIYIFLMICTVMAVTPSGDFDMERLARDDRGNIYVAGFAGNEALVCRLDEAGNMDRYYRCRREARDADLLCEYYEEKIYVCQMWHEDMDDMAAAQQRFNIWQTDGSGFRCVWQGTTESDTEFTDLRVDEEGISLAGIDLQTKEVLICRFLNDNLRILRYETEPVPLKVCFGGNGLYLLSEDGRMYLIGLEDGRQTRSDLGEAAGLIADEQGMYWQNAGSRDISYLLYDSSGICVPGHRVHAGHRLFGLYAQLRDDPGGRRGKQAVGCRLGWNRGKVSGCRCDQADTGDHIG